MNTTAIIFDEPESASVITEELGEPGPGRVTVEAILTQISTGTEMICYRGEADEGTHWADMMTYPRKNGYCMLGRVTAVGDMVDAVSVGDRVCAAAPHVSRWNVGVDKLWAPSIPEEISARRR